MRRRALAGLFISLISAGSMLLGVPAQAASTGITQKDAKQVLQGVGEADVLGSRGAIRPFAGSPWDGAHFCSADWHVVLFTWTEVGDASFTKSDAQAIMSGISLSFTLDGAALATTRIAVKRLDDPERFGGVEGWFFNQGRVMSPTDLSVGQHELSVTIGTPSGSGQDGITFFIDAAGTGACV
jgi:hypothetical protein